MRVLMYECPDAPEKRRFLSTWIAPEKDHVAGLTFARSTREEAQKAAQDDHDRFFGLGRKAGAEKALATRRAKSEASS